jgi:hypothetical protein
MVYFWLHHPAIQWAPARLICGAKRPITSKETKNMKNRLLVAVLSAAAISAAGCAGFERQSSAAGTSVSGNNALMGVWTSANIIPTNVATTCTNFKWDVSEQSAMTAKGNFSATCAGDLTVTGTAQGVLMSNALVSWSADANATAPGLTSCAIKLTGTANLTTDSIVVPYSGTTCLGNVSGTETLKRK